MARKINIADKAREDAKYFLEKRDYENLCRSIDEGRPVIFKYTDRNNKYTQYRMEYIKGFFEIKINGEILKLLRGMTEAKEIEGTELVGSMMKDLREKGILSKIKGGGAVGRLITELTKEPRVLTDAEIKEIEKWLFVDYAWSYHVYHKKYEQYDVRKIKDVKIITTLIEAMIDPSGSYARTK